MSGLFSGSEIAGLARLFRSSLPETADIVTYAGTVDAMGVPTTVPTGTVSVAARRYASGPIGEETPTGGLIRGEMQWTLAFPAGTSVGLTARVRFSDAEYEVTGLRGPRSYEYGRLVDAKLIV